MPKLKSESMPIEGGVNLVDSSDFSSTSQSERVAKSSAQSGKGIVTDSDTTTTMEKTKKTKTRAKKTGERKPRSKSKNPKKVTEASVTAAAPTLDIEEVSADDTLDFSVDRDAAEAPKRRRAHSHENGVLCEFCKLDDDAFAAAYKLMKNTDSRRKQTSELNAIQNPVFTAAPVNETDRPRFSKRLLSTVGTVLAVAMVALIWHEESSYTKAISLSDFGNKTFVTSDRDGALKFLHNAVSLSNSTGTTLVKARRWQDNWRDQLALVFGKPEQTLWLKAIPQGFQAQDGTIFYGKDSAEMKVIDSMNAVRDGAEKMYQTLGHYPTNIEELSSECAAGAVTVSQVNINEEIGSNLITAQGDTAFEHALKIGQKFGREKEVPNSVSCLEVKSEPSIASDFNSYGWKTNAFFVHGFDSKGKLISGSNGTPALLLSLKNGKRGGSILPEKTASHPTQPTSVWIYSAELPNENSIRFGFIAAAMLIILMVAGVIGKKAHDNIMSH
ncbi:MAG: hypothetical protein JST89_16510 [Cyanobacteria bacterium SZAS-4]|nr:hypothetical protein [Cyanobacteria bacterium SZAS-4]